MKAVRWMVVAMLAMLCGLATNVMAREYSPTTGRYI